MQLDVLHPRELGTTERARWAVLTAADPLLANPFFSLGWAELVGRFRDDARVVILHDAGRIAGFLPVQRVSGFTAMPLGAPLADYAGLIAEPGVTPDPAALARALDVRRIDLAHVPADQGWFAPHARVEDGSWVADISGGSAAYAARRKAARSGDMLKKVQQRRRKLEREIEGISLVPWDRSADAYEAMVAWKRIQQDETRQPDIFARPWIAGVIRAAFDLDRPDFGGAMFTVRQHGTPVATLFALRAGNSLHAWFTSYDRTLATYSPGNAAFLLAVEAAADAGFHEIDFGPGDYQIKRALATHQRPIVDGFLGATNTATLFRGAQFSVRRLLEARARGMLAALPGKAMRRIDHYRGMLSA